MSTERTRLVELGWVIVSGDAREVTRRAATRLCEHLRRQFPRFEWACDVVDRTGAPVEHPEDPLALLKLGSQEKIDHHWDFALVVASHELRARTRSFTLGVPSSALESAVVSTHRLGEGDAEVLAGAAQYLLGHLVGLAPADGAMRPPGERAFDQLHEFTADQRTAIEDRLEEVADARVEETSRKHRGRLGFYLQTLASDPRGILADVVGYRPWYQPFRVPSLTASSFLSMLFVFLGEEAWRLGGATSLPFAIVAAVLAIVGAALFLYRGQNLSEVVRKDVLREQLARTRLVLLTCMVVGMAALWVLLFGVSVAITLALPRDVIAGWLPGDGAVLPQLLRYAAFVATLGTLAGGLGGNLENQDEFAAKFFFDEEI